MNSMLPETWFVRAGQGGYYANDFVEKGVVAIGWVELGDLTKVTNREHLKRLVDEVYAERSEGQKRSYFTQVSKFIFDMSKGHGVITYDPKLRIYHIGQILGGFEYKPDLFEHLPNIRKIKWESKIPRDSLSASTKNSLGAIQTVFQPSEEALIELSSKVKGEIYTPTEASESIVEPKDIIEQAEEFIKDRLVKLSWEDMQDLVAGVLSAMGYKARVSPPGPDRGVDIIASPDGLGLTQPRIFVEVKHRPNEQISSKDIRNMIGGRNPQQDKCLFISTGGFSKDAKLEADRSPVPITLLDLDDVAGLLVQFYESLDPETKALMPLVKMYWPQT